MTKISQYSTDVNITGNDKWIGSDAQNFLITKNFTPNNLASFFNENNVIDIGTSIRYRYQTLLPGEAREQGTISFETEIGPQVNFSAITTFLIAKNTLKGNTVSQYLDFLVDSKVLLSKASNINVFGYYNITSIEPWIPNTNFFVVQVDFLAGNGFIYEDLDYLVSLVDKAQDTPAAVWGSITGDIEDQTDLINYISSQIITPTLAEVLAEGNTTGGENIVINDADAIQLENSSTLKKGTYDFGADGGISRICGVGFEDMWQSGIRHVFDSNGLIRNSTNGFNIVPDASFDNTLRFKVDSLWTLDNGDTYKCTDASTGAAVWELVNTGTTPTLQQVVTQGNSIDNDIIEFYEVGNSIGSIGGSNSFLLFDNYTIGGLKYALDAFNGFTINVQDDSQYTVLDFQNLGFADTIKSSNFNINGFSTTIVGAPTSKTLFINFPTTIVGTNKTQTFQDADGTIALLSDIPSGGVTSVTATSPITSSGGTTPDISTSMATNKLIGRSTAGTGVMEEITVGTGLSLSGGTLSASATGGGIPHGTAAGTDTYTVTISGVTSYADGDAYIIRFTNGNTTVCTLNINSLGAITLYRNNNGALIGGDIVDGGDMLCVYDSAINGFRVIGTAPNTLLSYVTNDDSVTLTKGMPVYAFSGTGDRMTVKRAYNTSDATSAQTVGLVLSTSIAANQKGLIIIQGLLDGLSILPTATFDDGDAIYLGATPGTITNIKPYAPNHLVYLGVVTTASNGAAGRMYVRVQNGYELQELHNVQAQSPSLNDTLWYDSTVSPGQWKTASIPTIIGYTPGTVTSVSSLTLGTTGTDLSSSVATGTTTPVITLNVPTASATNRGALNSTDWNTFNNKCYAINLGANSTTYLANNTYYFGIPTFAATSASAQRKILIPKSGTIKGGQIYVRTSAATTSENWTLSIRLNNASNTTFATVGTTALEKVFGTTSLNIAVVAGDFIEIITSTPAWVTGPGSSFIYGTIIIQ